MTAQTPVEESDACLHQATHWPANTTNNFGDSCENTSDRIAARVGGRAARDASEGKVLDARARCAGRRPSADPVGGGREDLRSSMGPRASLACWEGRRELILQRALFEPGVFGWPEHACRSCSLGADQVGHLAHLNARDTTLAYASRAPQADIARLKARMGWKMPRYTITDSFDADFGVDEFHGHNVFFREGDKFFRTYFVNAAATRRWGASGATWTSRYLAVRRAGRTRRGLPPDSAIQVVQLPR